MVGSQKFICGKGNGALKANFTTKSSGWKKNREVFELVAEVESTSSTPATIVKERRLSTGSDGTEESQGIEVGTKLPVIPSISNSDKGRSESARKEVLGIFAIKAPNDRYWMIIDDEAETEVLAVGLPPDEKQRSPNQLFYLEVYNGHLYALKSVKTNCYICVSKDSKDRVTCSADVIYEDCFFKLNLKVPHLDTLWKLISINDYRLDFGLHIIISTSGPTYMVPCYLVRRNTTNGKPSSYNWRTTTE